MGLISQLINSISRVLQNLLKYFNDTVILTFFLPLFSVLPASFCLNSNLLFFWRHISFRGISLSNPIIPASLSTAFELFCYELFETN